MSKNNRVNSNGPPTYPRPSPPPNPPPAPANAEGVYPCKACGGWGVVNKDATPESPTPAAAPVGVDERFARRVLAALIRERGTYEGEIPITEDDIHAALTAALAGKDGAK